MGENWVIIYSGLDKSDALLKVINGILYVSDGPSKIYYSKDSGDSFNIFYCSKEQVDSVYEKFIEPGIIVGDDRLYLVDNSSLLEIVDPARVADK